ncbi:beta-lactamase family protein [Lentzea tibetensis]|uniref:Beta-lactamase family protein n=1 Tax=Lentzea tibetensis TaxID=2591470 RepID=A0A563F100_9PSEU|nr:serine hydrolase domain-containing protein [Lentzea tibetensis]TWP53630.1 beta-lactamase family protein [Lentzea tibetensis]
MPGAETAHLGKVFADLVRRHGVPAAQLAIQMDGRAVDVTAGGVTPDAKFPVGSITKAFTASLAMLLVADGDLDVDDWIGAYLPELGTESDSLGGRLTLRQILSHTSGLPSSSDERSDVVSSPREYLRDCRQLTLVQPPGSGFTYSNVGYVFIGRIVEEITGMSWRDAIEALLLKPLGIVPSFIVPPDPRNPLDSFVSGHAVNETTGRALAVAQTMRAVEAPCGALALSAKDLVTFGRAHLTGSAPLDPRAFQDMRRPVSGSEPFGLADGWGLGLAVFRGADADWAGHDGNADGTSCRLRIDPAHDRVVALTTNANTGSALWDELVDELRAVDIPVGDYAAPELGARIPVPGTLFGSYSNGDMEYVVDGPDGATATLVVNGERYQELMLHEGWLFSVREPASGRRILGGRFLGDSSTGQASGIQSGGRVAGRGNP